MKCAATWFTLTPVGKAMDRCSGDCSIRYLFQTNEPVHVLELITNIEQRGIRTNYLLREASDLAVRLCCAPQVLESLRILEELKMLRLQDLVFGVLFELRRN